MLARGAFRLLLLLLLFSACGRTARHGAASVGTGGTDSLGSSGAPSTSGAPSASGAAGMAAQSCLFPRPGLTIEPTSDKPPTRYALTPPYPLDALPAPSEFAAAYEVNGDAVSDLLLLDAQSEPPRFRLLLTSPPPNVLDFVESDCEALRQLPAGRLLLRDLDGDGVQDFVVGTNDGVQAFLNREEGLRPALEYHLPSPTERAPLINLGLADLNGDEQSDLVVSFDRLLSETAGDFELYVQSFVQQDGVFAPGQSLATSFEQGSVASTGVFYTGYLTAGRFRPGEPGSALLVGAARLSSKFQFAQQTSFDGQEPVPLQSSFGQHTQQLFAVPRADAHSLVLAVGTTSFFLLDLSNPSGEPLTIAMPSIVAEGKLAFEGGTSHEWGGGAEQPRHFVYDLDRDGDLDFLEREPLGGRLALHVNFANESFEEAQLLEVDVGGSAEMPFMQLGPEGAIIGRRRAGQSEAAVYVLFSQPE
jgi:hypothetical protein